MQPPDHSEAVPRVRAASRDDAPVLAAFQCAMARETEGKQLDAERVRRGVDGVFAEPSRGRYLVAHLGDDARAVGCLLLTPEWSDWRATTFWWIQSVYVEPAARGRGVYRALYEQVLQQARAAGDVAGVRLYVDADNRAAQAVYERLGMAESHYRFYEVDFVLGAAAPRLRPDA